MSTANTMKLSDRVAIITGGAAGIGKACAIRFAQEGIRIVIGDLSDEDGRQTCRLIEDKGGRAVFAQGTIAQEGFCRHLADLAIQEWGRIDVLVANAAKRCFSSILDATGSEWDATLDVNLKGTSFSCRAVLSHMTRQQAGAIVLISSVHSQVGRSEMPIYDATKAALVSLAKSLAIEHAKDHIRVNAVCPGFTVTDFHIKKAKEEGRSVEDLKKTKFGPMQRPAAPSEIASAVYFLASDDASAITGQALMVDGGRSIE